MLLIVKCRQLNPSPYMAVQLFSLEVLMMQRTNIKMQKLFITKEFFTQDLLMLTVIFWHIVVELRN